MTSTPELAVIIVSWNTRELTLDALRALFVGMNDHGPNADVWVIDNASSDGSADAIETTYPRVRLIRSPSNLGFAGGNNLALRSIGFTDHSPHPTASDNQLPNAVYLLNSDTRSSPEATRALYDALLTLPNAGVVGAQLTYEDGSFQHGAFRFPGLTQLWVDLLPVPGRLHESALNGRYPRQAYAQGMPFEVDHTLGATMMLRREAIQQTGLFDESYFMYCEEIDWSIRIRRAGWDIYAVPAARVTHLAGQSTRQVRPQSIINLWRSRFRLFDKHYSPFKRFMARRIIRLGMQRQVRLANNALAAGTLSLEEHAALIAAYRTVQTM